MARMRCVESTRRVGGWPSNIYENDYIVEKDDGSCYKTFTTYEEAKLYQDYIQQQENQEKLIFEQKRTADETAALRKATEERYRIEREQPFRPPFPPPTRQVVDPEYQEWLQFKKATDPEFAKWKKAKDETARKAEEEHRRIAKEMTRKAEEECRRTAQEMEHKRAIAQREYKRKLAAEQKRKEKEHEEYMKNKQKEIEELNVQTKKDLRFLVILAIVVAILLWVSFAIL